MKRLLLASLFLLGLTWQASAASCFSVTGGGSVNYSDTTHWASSTGGTGGTCAATGGYPHNAADTATFDGASGGGTVTWDVDTSITTLTFGAFTGTLALNGHTLSLSTQFSGSGTGARTFNCGTGIVNITSTSTALWNFQTMTSLTWTCTSGTVNITFSSAGSITNNSNLNFNALSFGTLSLSTSVGGTINFSGSSTIATLTLSAPATISFPASATQTVTTLNCTGTSSSLLALLSATVGTASTISVASGTPTCQWAAIHDMTFSGGATFAATSSFGLGHNSGITITAPTGGGGGGFVGLIGGGT